MADRCGDCKYYDKRDCENPRWDKDHDACREFKSK